MARYDARACPAAQAAVFDLDGVIRHFDPSRLARIAAEHGLAPGDLLRAAFDPALLHEVVTGGLTRAAWVHAVGLRLGAPAAARAWLDTVGTVDPAVLAVVEGLRARGLPVAILTNGTDTIDDELDQLGIRGHFDAVVSTWHVGAAKPDPAAYEAVRATTSTGSKGSSRRSGVA